MCLRGDITLRPETQEDVHSLIIIADDEGSVDAMIMRGTPILNVNELCIVDFVDLKMGNNPSSSVQSVAVSILSMKESFSIKFRAFEFLMLKPTRPLLAYATDILSILFERVREFLLQVALLLLQHLLLLKTRGKFTLVGKDNERNTRVL